MHGKSEFDQFSGNLSTNGFNLYNINLPFLTLKKGTMRKGYHLMGTPGKGFAFPVVLNLEPIVHQLFYFDAFPTELTWQVLIFTFTFVYAPVDFLTWMI